MYTTAYYLHYGVKCVILRNMHNMHTIVEYV